MSDFFLRAALVALIVLVSDPVNAQREGTALDGERSAAKVYYLKLKAEFEAAESAFIEQKRALLSSPEYRERRVRGDQEGIAKMRERLKRPAGQFLARFRKGAADHAGHADAAWFLAWIVTEGEDKAAARTAIQTLQRNHTGSEAMGSVARSSSQLLRLIGREHCRAILGQLSESPHKTVQAEARYARAMMVLCNHNAPERERKAAEDDLRRVEVLVPGTHLAFRVAALRFEKERLQDGMIVPNIEGEDLDGVPFRLSDYRGKVILLSFWGDW